MNLFFLFLTLLIPTPQEKAEIDADNFNFCVESYFAAGLYPNKNKAIEAVKEEITGEEITFKIYSEEHQANIGFLVYSLHSERQAFIEGIYLYEPYRRKGFGTETLTIYEEHLREQGVEESLLYVFAHNIAGQNLYHKMGYTVLENYAPIGYVMHKKLIGINY